MAQATVKRDRLAVLAEQIRKGETVLPTPAPVSDEELKRRGKRADLKAKTELGDRHTEVVDTITGLTTRQQAYAIVDADGRLNPRGNITAERTRAVDKFPLTPVQPDTAAVYIQRDDTGKYRYGWSTEEDVPRDNSVLSGKVNRAIMNLARVTESEFKYDPRINRSGPQ